jgi:hypothetical protein
VSKRASIPAARNAIVPNSRPAATSAEPSAVVMAIEIAVILSDGLRIRSRNIWRKMPKGISVRGGGLP